MPTSCSAPGCTQRFTKGSDIHFYRLPKDGERKLRWQKALKRVQIDNPNKLWEPADHDRLCSLHFVSGKPSTDPGHPDYAPSIFNFTPGPVPTKTPKSVDRFERLNKRRRRLILSPLESNENNLQVEADTKKTAADALLDLGRDLPQSAEAQTQTESDPLQQKYDQLQDDHRKLQTEYQRLMNENWDLKQELNKTKFTVKNLSNSHISSMTGLPSLAVFYWIFSLVSMRFKPLGKLGKEDMILLVLMKLRLNLTNKDLAFRFQIAPTQVSTILGRCLPVLAKRLKCLIKWPSKDVIMKNMPKSFRKKYRRCRVIIDCSEVFIQRPSNLDARAKTWSNYKSHNTMKFLIGITPYGAVSFISKCWGGRVSDKEITEKSGFYDYIEHGDQVLADRGFLIADELAIRGATLAIPPFGKGKTQFLQREVENARKLSQARIHVERAIERVKRFHILKNTMAISMIPHADSILTICAALTNLLPRLVTK